MKTQGQATKKPIPINWLKWEGSISKLNEWAHKCEYPKRFNLQEHFDWNGEMELKVKTLEGSSYKVPLGYILIRGIKGEYYPCEPKIFNESYDTI